MRTVCLFLVVIGVVSHCTSTEVSRKEKPSKSLEPNKNYEIKWPNLVHKRVVKWFSTAVDEVLGKTEVKKYQIKVGFILHYYYIIWNTRTVDFKKITQLIFRESANFQSFSAYLKKQMQEIRTCLILHKITFKLELNQISFQTKDNFNCWYSAMHCNPNSLFIPTSHQDRSPLLTDKVKSVLKTERLRELLKNYSKLSN